MKVNILGTEYNILKKTYKEEPCLKDNTWGGFCDSYTKTIIILDLDKTEDWNEESQKTKDLITKSTMRHEITHAFLFESGLKEDSTKYSKGWATNEEMVDWIAWQSVKLVKAYKECGCI